MWEAIERILAYVGTMSLLALLASSATLAACVLQERRRRREQERKLQEAREEQERQWMWRAQQKARPRRAQAWKEQYPAIAEFLHEFCFEHGFKLE